MKSYLFTNDEDINVAVLTDGWGAQTLFNITDDPYGDGVDILKEKGLWFSKDLGFSVSTDDFVRLAKLMEVQLYEVYDDPEEMRWTAEGQERKLLVPKGTCKVDVSIQPSTITLKVKKEIHPIYITCNMLFTPEDGEAELTQVEYAPQTAYFGNSINVAEAFFKVQNRDREVMCLMNRDASGRSGYFAISALLPPPYNVRAELNLLMEPVTPPPLF